MNNLIVSRETFFDLYFSDTRKKIEGYVDLLIQPGMDWGLLGPGEKDRIWERHIFNCVVLEKFIPTQAKVLDMGTGAGLPAVPLILARKDIKVIAIEPMPRRVKFLDLVKTNLNLDLTIIKGKAEDKSIIQKVGKVDIVTARALANINKLCRLALPYMKKDSKMLFLKGMKAMQELTVAQAELKQLKIGKLNVKTLGEDLFVNPTHVVIAAKK